MAANIIESNTDPIATKSVDPITLDLIENALRNARLEMDATLFRTALSPGIREQGDAFPMIANREGKMVVGQFGSFLGGFLAGYEGDIEEGDGSTWTGPWSTPRSCGRSRSTTTPRIAAVPSAIPRVP